MRLWKGHTHRNHRPLFLSLGYPFLSGGYLWVFCVSIFFHCGHWGRHGPGVLRSESKNDLLSHSHLIKSGAGLWSAQLCPELPTWTCHLRQGDQALDRTFHVHPRDWAASGKGRSRDGPTHWGFSGRHLGSGSVAPTCLPPCPGV